MMIFIRLASVVKAFQDWEEAHTVKKEKKTKAKVVEEKKKGAPRKVSIALPDSLKIF